VLTVLAGPQFAPGAPALIVIAFAIALAAVSHVLRFTLIACERPRFVLFADAAACTCAFATYFSLIPKFSLLGAAIGTVVAEICALAGMLHGLKRAGRLLPSLANPAKAVLTGAVAAAAMLALDRLELHWLLALAAGGGIYIAGLALTRAIPREILLLAESRLRRFQRPV
jgi:O-antigen/teichoic acid export membrane protein